MAIFVLILCNASCYLRKKVFGSAFVIPAKAEIQKNVAYGKALLNIPLAHWIPAIAEMTSIGFHS